MNLVTGIHNLLESIHDDILEPDIQQANKIIVSGDQRTVERDGVDDKLLEVGRKLGLIEDA